MSNQSPVAEPEVEADVWLTTEQVAEKLGLHPQTLRQWRHRGGVGPRSYKMGGAVRYKEADIASWLEQNASNAGETSSQG